MGCDPQFENHCSRLSWSLAISSQLASLSPVWLPDSYLSINKRDKPNYVTFLLKKEISWQSDTLTCRPKSLFLGLTYKEDQLQFHCSPWFPRTANTFSTLQLSSLPLPMGIFLAPSFYHCSLLHPTCTLCPYGLFILQGPGISIISLCLLPFSWAPSSVFPFSNLHHHSCFCCFLATKLCPTLCDPIDCSPPGSSVHGFP